MMDILEGLRLFPRQAGAKPGGPVQGQNGDATTQAKSLDVNSLVSTVTKLLGGGQENPNETKAADITSEKNPAEGQDVKPHDLDFLGSLMSLFA